MKKMENALEMLVNVANSSEETITLKRKDLAKFMAVSKQTLQMTLEIGSLDKRSLNEAYVGHMQPGYIEGIIPGIAKDFDNFPEEE